MPDDEIKIDDRTLATERMWGLPAIADFLGLGIDAVRDLAKDPDVPIFKPGNRYVAFRSELWKWMRQKPQPTISDD
ncbi:MAG: hypothetical protein WBB98_12095 [Xanthobacteraceae bacterium]